LQNDILKGSGAQINPANPFNQIHGDEEINHLIDEDGKLRTEFIDVHPKTMLNKVDSPDIPMDWSMNPYQGCEHGCVYCYARNTHTYWGYSAGLDFEQKILVKKEAPQLVEKKIKHRNWKASPIMLSGNTDCYQPIERELEITRNILKVLWKYRHPVGIITKNSLVTRDIDILKPMAEHNLVRVAISITTLDESLRSKMEPRTASIHARLSTIEKLTKNGIPVNVMFAPIIPGLNDHEIFKVAELTSQLGASGMGYTLVRLNGDIAAIFTDWIKKTFPDRAERVLNRIKDCHGGSLQDSRLKKRMRGEGNFAEIIRSQYQLAKKKYFSGRNVPPYNLELHEQFKSPQLKLF
jgi:DNA repair photolyase